MKKVVLLYGFFLMLAFLGCKKESQTPGCISSKIEEFKQTTSCNIGSSVKEYKFQSKRVFVFDPGTCGADLTSQVFDENCNSLGYLGGIAGNSKINGEDFNQAKFVRIVWVR